MSDTKLHELAQFDTVWRMMRELVIPEIIVSFNGEGDSGEITAIEARQDDYSPGIDHEEYARRVAAVNAKLDTRTGLMLDTYEHGDAHDFTLGELVHRLTEPMLDNLNEDWVNNEGGFGTVHWELDPEPGIRIELSIRVVSTEDHTYTYNKFGEDNDGSE